MAENFITCINTTLPAFVLILLGLALSRAGLMPEDFTAKLNRFVFLFPLPVMVFYDLASKNFREAWNGRFVFFCFAATLLSIGGITLISGPLCRKAPEERGEFIQAAYRSSAAILGDAGRKYVRGCGNDPDDDSGSRPAVQRLRRGGSDRVRSEGKRKRSGGQS